MRNTEALLMKAADKQTSQVLIESIDRADAQREIMVRDWRAGDTENIVEIQASNAAISAIIAVLVHRHPALDDAIDEWCEAMDVQDDRTMARFIVDAVMDNPAVIA